MANYHIKVDFYNKIDDFPQEIRIKHWIWQTRFLRGQIDIDKDYLKSLAAIGSDSVILRLISREIFSLYYETGLSSLKLYDFVDIEHYLGKITDIVKKRIEEYKNEV